MSHTILYGVVKAFLELICDSGNGIFVDGVAWHLSTAQDGLMARMNAIIKRIHLTSAYNRGVRLLTGPSDKCASPRPPVTAACILFPRMHMYLNTLMQGNRCISVVF